MFEKLTELEAGMLDEMLADGYERSRALSRRMAVVHDDLLTRADRNSNLAHRFGQAAMRSEITAVRWNIQKEMQS